ncbi:Mediator of RNA polymerase II transcription subunit 26 [Nymphon striatum]|nr:Mediator of RNA polymerase II transcription subunit 26 [Nymphon striatum]
MVRIDISIPNTTFARELLEQASENLCRMGDYSKLLKTFKPFNSFPFTTRGGGPSPSSICYGQYLWSKLSLFTSPNEYLASGVIEGLVEGKRDRGRQRRVWGDDLKEWTRSKNLGEVKRKAENKVEWRIMVHDLRFEDVLDMAAVTEVLALLEKISVSKDLLEVKCWLTHQQKLQKVTESSCPHHRVHVSVTSSLTVFKINRITVYLSSPETRLGKHINGLRKKTKDKALASRAKSLVRRWRDFILPEHNQNSVNGDKNAVKIRSNLNGNDRNVKAMTNRNRASNSTTLSFTSKPNSPLRISEKCVSPCGISFSSASNSPSSSLHHAKGFLSGISSPIIKSRPFEGIR